MSLSRHVKFTSWLSRWVDKYVSADDLQRCTDFLLGSYSNTATSTDATGSSSDDASGGDVGGLSGLVPCETRRQTVAACNDRPPYCDYYKYHVTYTRTCTD